MNRIAIGVIVIHGLLAACAACTEDRPAAGESALSDEALRSRDSGVFTPTAVADPPAEGTTEQPVYVFLFTHTEDPFNHALSEARYTNTGETLRDLATDYPASHPEWTIHFQGSDAKTVAERNSTTGVVDYLRTLAADGIVHFGYHGQHDPTTTNRPQSDLTASSTFEEIATAFDDWVSCERDLANGDCVTPDVGGVVQIQASFGPLEIYSGLAAGDEGAGPYEDGGGHWALRRHVVDVRLAFGYSDHAPALAGYDANLARLMTLLTPSGETSGGVFWAEDALRINDGNQAEGVHVGSLLEGAATVSANLAGLNTHRIQVLNAGIASKYIYAKTSPTEYGYAHPTRPTLPLAQTYSAAEIQAHYEATEAGLRYLAGTFFAAHAGSRFIGTDELLQIAAPADLFEVTADELDRVARWTLTHWGAKPPSYVSDGTEFYSLRDATGLLGRALAARAIPATQTMTRFYGPEDATAATGSVRMSAAQIRRLAATIAASANAAVPSDPGAWTPTPPNLLASTFASGRSTLNAAQALYALAMLYASTVAGTPVTSVTVPATEPVPETFAIYEALGSISCEDTAWSTKPARLRALH